MKKIYVLVCNHYDLAWRRRAYEDFIDNGRNFVSYSKIQEYGINQNLAFAKEYPFYKFNIECVSVIRTFLRNNPSFKETIKELISQGRIGIPFSGDNIIDVNLVNGESVVRNFVSGHDWLKNNLNCTSSVLVRNDAFGNCSQLPQISKLLGCDWIWGLNYTPVTGDYWEGLDGTKIFVGQLPVAGTGGSWRKYAPCPHCNGFGCEKCNGMGIFREKAEESLSIGFDFSVFDKADEALLISASEEILPSIKLIDWYFENKDKYEIEFVTYDDVRCKVLDRLSFSDGESLHNSLEHNPNNTGCYSTRIRTKLDVHRLEYRLLKSEYIASMMYFNGVEYPHEKFDLAWEKLLTLMAHDIVTGEHIDAVYEDFLVWVSELDEFIDNLEKHCFSAKKDSNHNYFSLYNPFGNTYVGEIILEKDGVEECEYLVNGNPIEVLSQTKKAVSVLVSVPPRQSIIVKKEKLKGVKFTEEKNSGNKKTDNVLQAKNTEAVQNFKRGTKTTTLENSFYLIEADEFGLASFYDKRLKRFLCFGDNERFCEVVYEHDEGSPWATLSDDRKRLSVNTALLSVFKGENYQKIAYSFNVDGVASYSIDAMSGVVEFIMYNDSPGIDAKIHSFCDDYNHRLKIEFNVDMEGDVKNIYGVPFGCMERAEYEPSYYWAGSNGDWPAYNWAGCENGNFSVAVINNGTPSYDISRKEGKSKIGVTLRRSPCLPTYLHEPESYTMTAYSGMRDVGHVVEKVAFIVYNSPFSSSNVCSDAEQFSFGLIKTPVDIGENKIPYCDDRNVTLAGVRILQNGRLSFRIIGNFSQHVETEVYVPRSVRSVYFTDMLYNKLQDAEVVKDKLKVSLKPHQILTVVMEFD